MWPISEAFTITFWGVIALWFLMELAFCYEGRRAAERWAVLILFLAIFILFSDFNPVIWVWQNPVNAIKYAIFYFGIGAVWSLIKWRLIFLPERARDYADREADLRREFNRGVNSTGTTYSEWLQRFKDFPPSAKENADRIQFWIGWWPFSIITTVIGDLMFRVVRKIYEFLSGLYDAMSKSAFSKFDLK